jgi:4a-hydroxytetrahydrobiopterin dehydratase
MTALHNMSCKPQSGAALSRTEAEKLLCEIPGWTLNDAANEIKRSFEFPNYYETLAFVNALAWVAHREDHHPDLGVSYNHCKVRFSTHSVRGLSENDFICAAKIDALNGID